MQPPCAMVFRVCACFTVWAAAASHAHAGGQYVGGNGSQGLQRAGAFAAKADDPTAIYYNPAGLALSKRRGLFFGVNAVQLEQTFERFGAYESGEAFPTVEHDGAPQPVPFVAAVFPNKKYTLGLGIFAPQGYPTRNYADTMQMEGGAMPAPQRYDTVYQTAKAVFPSAAVAVDVSDELRIGARASVGYGQFESRKFVQGLPNADERGSADSDVTFQGKDPAMFTWGAGLHYRASAHFEIGAAYSAPVRVHAVGTSTTVLGTDVANIGGVDNRVVPVDDAMAQCERGGTENAIKACLDLTLPQTATLGMRWIARDDDGAEVADVEIDVRWENWAAASDYVVTVDGQTTALGSPLEATVIPHGFEDVLAVRLGGSGRIPRGDTTYVLSGGVAYDSAAAPRTWSRLDVDGAERFTASGGIAIEKATYKVDIGGAFIESPRRVVRDIDVGADPEMESRVQPDITVPLSASDAQPYHPFNAGTYKTRYLVASVGVTTWW